MRGQHVRARFLLLCLGVVLHFELGHAAVDTTMIRDKLDQKKTSIRRIRDVIEMKWADFLNRSTSDGTVFPRGVSTGVLSGCGNTLPLARCDPTLGLAQGCECSGKKVTDNTVIIKPLAEFKDEAFNKKAGNVAAFLAQDQNLSNILKSVSGQLDYENKLMYFGSIDGVMTYYPAMLWTRDDGTCGDRYDPRQRPWFLSGSNGPKNVILILDSSGSMQNSGRMELLKTAAKQLVDSMTFADYIGVVDFDDEARTFLGLTFMAAASAPFRGKIKDWIDNIKDGGGTNYDGAFARAFEMADISYETGYHSKCQTVFVFITDGENTGADPTPKIQQRRSRLGATKNEMYIIIGLGSEATKMTSNGAGVVLKKLACESGGIFESVPDGSSDSTGRYTNENEMIQALMTFSRFFQASNSILQRKTVSFSEIYTGTNMKMDMTTASAAVYDKTDVTRWKMLGVVGIDVTTCDLEKRLFDTNPDIQQQPLWPEETKIPGCKCAEHFVYDDKEYTGCTVVDWPMPWCGTINCGIRGPTVTDTGYWADCKPFGVRAELEAELLRSGEECETQVITQCQVEALRREGLKCGGVVDCTPQALAREQDSNFFSGLPGAKYRSDTSQSSWAENARDDVSFDSVAWSDSGETCKHCENEAMRPQCALPPICGKSGIPSLQDTSLTSATPTTTSALATSLSLSLFLSFSFFVASHGD